MPAPTDTEMLDSARTALKALTDGRIQSATVGGRSYTHIDIDKLLRLIENLEIKISIGSRRPFSKVVLRGFG